MEKVIYGVRVTDSFEVVDGVVDGNDYIELAVRAYDLAKLVEISAGTDAGSYDLAAYLAFASVQGNQKLVAVVNALVDYAAKAAAYKA